MEGVGECLEMEGVGECLRMEGSRRVFGDGGE